MPPWEKYSGGAPVQAPKKPWEKRAPQAAPIAEAPQEEEGMLSKAFGTAMKALDYPAGLARTAMAPMLGLGSPMGPEQSERVMQALKGEAPTVSEMMAEAGVAKGPEAFGISARDVAGFVGDIATDPLTYAGGLGIAGKLAKPIKSVSKSAGKGLYKRAFTEADNVAKQFNKKYLPSKVLWDEGVTGTAKSVEKKAATLASKYGKERKVLIDMADKKGATVSPRDMFKPAFETVGELSKSVDPADIEAAQTGMEFITNYMKKIPKARRTNLKPSEVQSMKANMYNAIGKPAYDSFRKTPMGKQVMKDLAKGFKKATEKSVEKATGKGKQYIDLNERIGSLLTTQKTLGREAQKAMNKKIITKGDFWMTMYDPMLGAAGKAADIMSRVPFKTTVGKGIERIGRAADDPLRRILINLNREDTNEQSTK